MRYPIKFTNRDKENRAYNRKETEVKLRGKGEGNSGKAKNENKRWDDAMNWDDLLAKRGEYEGIALYEEIEKGEDDFALLNYLFAEQQSVYKIEKGGAIYPF